MQMQMSMSMRDKASRIPPRTSTCSRRKRKRKRNTTAHPCPHPTRPHCQQPLRRHRARHTRTPSSQKTNLLPQVSIVLSIPPFHRFRSSFASQRMQTSISLVNSSQQLKSRQLSLLLPRSLLPCSLLLLPQSASAQAIVCIIPLSSIIPRNNRFLFIQQYPMSLRIFVRHPFLSQFLHTYSHTSRCSEFRAESNHNTPHPQRP